MKSNASKLTTAEFAVQVGLSYARVMQMVQRGDIETEKFGRAYMIDAKLVEIVRNRPERRGRKPKIAKVRIAA